MAETETSKAEAVAEKAYAAASEALPAKVSTPPVAVAPVAVTPAETSAVDAVAFPPKAKRGRKPRAIDAVPAKVAEAKVEPATNTVVVEATPAVATPANVAAKPVAAAKSRKPIRATKAVKAAKPAAKRVVAKPVAPAAVQRPAPRKAPAVAAIVSHTKAAPKPAPTAVSNPLFSQIKDHTMTEVTTAFTDTVKGAFTEVQSKAKVALQKGSAAFAGYNEFAKGNVEAVVESGKILAAGLQDLTTNIAAESRSAFETATGDIKELAAAKSPADFFKLQSDLFRRNFDAAVAYNSKASEAVLKLTNEVFAPISGRVSLAVEKVRSVA